MFLFALLDQASRVMRKRMLSAALPRALSFLPIRMVAEPPRDRLRGEVVGKCARGCHLSIEAPEGEAQDGVPHLRSNPPSLVGLPEPRPRVNGWKQRKALGIEALNSQKDAVGPNHELKRPAIRAQLRAAAPRVLQRLALQCGARLVGKGDRERHLLGRVNPPRRQGNELDQILIVGNPQNQPVRPDSKVKERPAWVRHGNEHRTR